MRSPEPAFPPDLDVDLADLSLAAEPWFARLVAEDMRIQAAPDARTIRFYQSSGLLDRPQRYSGRVARYGRRHLLQLVAVRALQSQGLSLAQVQSKLAGATDRELQRTVSDALKDASVDVPRKVRDPEPIAVQPRVASTPPPANAAPLVAAELVPGVVVTIDSRLHPDVARILTALRDALTRASDVS